jgi:hypothetical protein
LNGIHQFLVYDDDINIQIKSLSTTKRNKEALLEASNFALEVNTEKTEYIFVSRHQNAVQNCNLLIPNKSFQFVAKLKHFEATAANQNFMHEEIKSRFNSGIACCDSVVSCLSVSSLKNLRLKLKKT